jgi:putative heme-binding domain-containing protein
LVLARWAQFSPGERSKATDLLLRRGTWALALAEYLEKQGVRITTLEPSHATMLENYPSAKVREIARKLRGQGAPADRQQVFNDYREVLQVSGNAEGGKQVFLKNCSTCHEMGGVGTAVGPNLAAMVNRGGESVLFNVLAPNMEVDPRFLEYVVLTNDGQVITGVVAGETSTAVTLRGAENKTTTVLRVDIDEMHNSGKSLMPEGFEKLIDKKSMADLLKFLKVAAAQASALGEKK